MNIVNCTREFFRLNLTIYIRQFFRFFLPPNQQLPDDLNHQSGSLSPLLLLAFCLNSAIEMALLFLQTKTPFPFDFFRLLSVSIILAFASLIVSRSIKYSTTFCVAAYVLEQGGIFFAFTSFFIAITNPVSLAQMYSLDYLSRHHHHHFHLQLPSTTLVN